MLKEYLTKIADALRSALGITTAINAQDFPDKVSEVYEAGKKAQHDEFWDSYMYNANNCIMRFACMGWCANNFYPKHDMRPSNANQMFMNFSYGRGPSLDLVERLEECGVELDFSNCVVFNAMLSYANINHIGVVDCSGSESAVGVFGQAQELITVDKWIVHKGITDYRNAFQNAKNLRNITVEGVIAANIDMSESPLSKESYYSVMGALSDETIGLTATLGDLDSAFDTSEEGQEEKYALIDSKPNWTITEL